jgi:hypothetical protein
MLEKDNDSDSDTEPKDLFSSLGIYKLIKNLNMPYNKQETKEIIKELGLKKNETIQIEDLVSKSQIRRMNSKYSEFYENILNRFVPSSERMIQILNEAMEKLSQYKEDNLVQNIAWVIKKINGGDDIYNINMDSIEILNASNSQEIENTVKLLNEYSSDDFNKHKKENLIQAKRMSEKRTHDFLETPQSNVNPILRKSLCLKDMLTSPHFNLPGASRGSKKSNTGQGASKRISNFGVINEEEDDDNQKLQLIAELSKGKDSVDIELITEPDFKEYLSIDNFDFNIFEYTTEYGRENVLINIADYIMNKFNLYLLVNIQRFEMFIDKIRVGYNSLLPYHNDLHAADVLQTCYSFTSLLNLKTEMDLSYIDLMGFFVAAIIHDYKHPGLNNTYHINKKSSIAIKYNDISVLENYHVSAAFKVMLHPSSNIFKELQVEEYRVIRKRIVECVLATDMAKHTKSQTSLKIKLDQFKGLDPKQNLYNLVHNQSEETKFDRQQEVLNFLIHCSDISNPTKDFIISKEWTDRVMEEFFQQGDLEKSEMLPISFLCDRNGTRVAKSQVMFINSIVKPCYKVLRLISPSCQLFLDGIEENLKHWKKLESIEEKEK